MRKGKHIRLFRRLLFAAVLAALLYSAPSATRPAAAQYPYGCDCTIALHRVLLGLPEQGRPGLLQLQHDL
jgi:hypothetical protein